MPDNDKQNEQNQNRSQEQQAKQEPQAKPPAHTESVGSGLPAPPAVKARGPELKEKQRLDNMGVKNDDGQVRGVNVKAEGHHAPDPINHPRELPQNSLYGEGEFKVDEYGTTIPAITLHAPKIAPPAQPAPQNPQQNPSSKK